MFSIPGEDTVEDYVHHEHHQYIAKVEVLVV